MVLREQLLTAEQFFEIARLPENKERRLELEDGVIVEMAASRPINTVIASRVGHFLNSHILPNDLGYVTSPDGGFKLASGRVRQPDVAFVSKKRYPKLPSEFEGGPDLAIEVVSPNEDVLKKVDEYLEAGTQLVWAIYPDSKDVHVFAPQHQWKKLGIDDTLTGENVLPDFELPVKDIFPPETE